jgi:hypothetical protein
MTPIPGPEIRGQQIASGLIPVTDIVGDDEQDTLLLTKMSYAAVDYISSFAWCETIHNSYFGGGVGGIFAVFFFHIRPGRPEVDPWIWVVVGDIPPAYIPLSDSDSPSDVFRSYIRGMNRWVDMARHGGIDDKARGVPPVNLPATPEWAEKINQKLYGVTLAVKPFFEGGSESLRNLQ